MKAYTFKNLIGLLLVTTDLGSKTRPSTPAVLAQLLIDDASCLADNEVCVLDSGRSSCIAREWNYVARNKHTRTVLDSLFSTSISIDNRALPNHRRIVIPAQPKVFDSATDGHPSKSATSDRGCDERFEFCYESCLVGFWNRPAPGACHMVCTIMKETCER